MERHITILGILYIGYNTVSLIMGIVAAVALLGISAAGNVFTDDFPPAPLFLLNTVGITLLIVFTVISLPGIIAGIGLIKFKQWGRILGLIVAVVNLFSFPVGTAISIYALWVLLSQETNQYLN